jgi:uncharacterized peroxidase-related enzyme
MPHIRLAEGVPGIRGALQFRPETAGPLMDLAEALLRAPGTLSCGEREILAAAVSRQNGCHFCEASHRAAAAHHMGGDYSLVDAVLTSPETAPISAAFRALLGIALKVARSGKEVTEGDIATARAASVTDREIHDVVLIAAAFSMFNRYVDGLAAFTPEGHDIYDQMGKRMASVGYAAHLPRS